MNAKTVEEMRASVESAATPFMKHIDALVKVSLSAQSVNNIAQRLILLNSISFDPWRIDLEKKFLKEEMQKLMECVEAATEAEVNRDI